jgi:hypothetical protein
MGFDLELFLVDNGSPAKCFHSQYFFGANRNGKTRKKTLKLEKVCELCATRMPANEYLLDRHDLDQGRDYNNLVISAKWSSDPESDSILIDAIFELSSEQYDAMKYNLQEEDFIDDLDSGLGEEFETALGDVYPGCDWSHTVGKVKVKAKKIKG